MSSFDLFLAGRPLFDGDRPSEAAIAAVMAHSRFVDAMRRHARRVVSTFRGNRIDNLVMTDRARFLMGMLALHLHHSAHPDDPRSGLTAARMRALCAAQGICSPGRAEATLMVMRLVGYLASAPGAADRRLRRLVPTERLTARHRQQLAINLETVAELLPEGAAALSRLDSPEFLTSYISHMCEFYLAGFHVADLVPELTVFFAHKAGMVLGLSLLQSGAPDDTFPPTRPVPFSLSAQARSFGISRVQARRLLQLALSNGLIERAGSDTESFRVLPRFADATRRLMAINIVHNAHCARATLADIGRRSAVA